MPAYTRRSDGYILLGSMTIPPDPNNADFAAYQAWTAQGNTAPPQNGATVSLNVADQTFAQVTLWGK